MAYITPTRKLSTLLVAGAIAVFSAAANAVPTFNGQSLFLEYLFPNVGTVFNSSVIVVGPGVDQVGFADRAVDEIDIFDNTILFDFQSSGAWNPAAFNGPRFTDLNGTINEIIGFSVNPLTNMAGFSAALVSFTGDSIQWNWQGLGFDSDTIVAIDVQFADVPEPGTLGLVLGAGLIGFRFVRRRRVA